MPGLCPREEEREEQRLIAQEQDWAREHADRINGIAKAVCSVNSHEGRIPCLACISSARKFFVSMTINRGSL